MECTQPVAVYYLASGKLGVPLLDALAGDGRVRLLGVGTQPDRPRGRQLRLEPTAVAAHADRLGIRADRVPSVNQEGFLSHVSELRPELLVVASFGQILKPALLSLPPCGCLNIHASLLPRHRGASPVSAAILAGDRRTGITFMRMDAGLDTGPIYRQAATDIGAEDDAESVEARLASLAAAGLVDCIVAVARQALMPSPQPAEGVTYAPRLAKEDGLVNWSTSARQIERQVRALRPWPCAFTVLPGARGNRRLQILAAAVDCAPAPAARPGDVVCADGKAWTVACGEGSLRLLRVRAEGKHEMSAADFLRGSRIPAGTRLGTTSGQEE
jgi:methionyl-tRNA formyltransferase